MSNDTGYSLKFRHPKKARLREVRTYLAEIKPAIYRFYQNMKFAQEWSGKQRLELLGVRKWSEVVTWFGHDAESIIIPSFGTITKQGDEYVMEVGAGANEGGGNVWISGPDGELADLLERFPGLEITGTFSDQYGEGRIDGFEKIHELDAIQSKVRDPYSWEEEECAAYSDATKELLVRCYQGELDLQHLSRLLRQGADVNAQWHYAPLIDSFASVRFQTPEELGSALDMILDHGWQYDVADDWLLDMFKRPLLALAKKLRETESTLKVRLKMAAVLLGRETDKNEDGPQLFQDSLKARDVPGLLASAFLGANFEAKAAKAAKASTADRAWLKQQGLLE